MTPTDQEIRTRTRRNRIILLFMVVIFASPPLAGWLFYLNPQWIPEGRRNHGELITPPRSLQDLAVFDEQGAPFDWSHLTDLWTLVVVADGGCSDVCAKLVEHVMRIRRAIGADRLRTSAVLLMRGTPSPGSSYLPPEESGFRVLYTETDSLQEVAALFDLANADASSRIYLVDTRGALMMRHDLAELGPQEVIEDLEVLLAASRNWRTGQASENP